jgi:hypothetical protein
MATSYKQLHQEAMQEIERLTALVASAASEVAKLAAEVERTREIVDLAGIAEHMRVERYTPQQWSQRGLLPPVDFPQITGVPLWYASTVRDQFAKPTRRVWYDSDAEELSPAA